MGLNDQELKRIIVNDKLNSREDVKKFIVSNKYSLDIEDLSRIAELVNNSRVDTAAYYTDKDTLGYINDYLPDIQKKTIRILEPSVGVGNFIDILVSKYKGCEKLIIEVNDVDEDSIEITRLLNEKRNIPDNVEFVYHCGDFLTTKFKHEFDLIVGNPPFLKLRNKETEKYSEIIKDNFTKNISGLFLDRALKISNHVCFILPKYFLNSDDFESTRNKVKDYSITNIIDFGVQGFKGVLIETIALIVNTKLLPSKTQCFSTITGFSNIQNQEIVTDSKFPYWLIYRNEKFDSLAQKMQFNIFSVFRDRQLTNKVLKKDGDIRVLKSRNILRDGSGIVNLEGYDSYINLDDLGNKSVSRYLNRDDVYLSPNMTYYPRVIKKPKNILVNGSVAILEKNDKFLKIQDSDLEFFSSKEFEEFYRVARNYSTRSLNIDSKSIFFFGVLKKDPI